jgi:hypothetical protein
VTRGQAERDAITGETGRAAVPAVLPAGATGLFPASLVPLPGSFCPALPPGTEGLP